LLAATMAMAGSVSGSTQAIRYYEDAVNRFNAGDSKGASIQLRNSLQRDPTQLSARVLLGQVQLDLGNPMEAEKVLLTAAQLGADPNLIALPLAKAQNILGKHKTVVETLHPTKHPVSLRADLWVELAKARHQSDDRVGSEIALGEALKIDANHEGALATQGWMSLERDDYERANQAATRILDLYPESPQGWLLMGTVYRSRGAFESAAAHFRQATVIEPENLQARLGEALALLDAGENENASVLFEQMRVDFPLVPEPHYFHSRVLNRLGDASRAAEALDKAADIVRSLVPSDLKKNTSRILLIAKIKYDTGDLESAYGFLSRYLAFNPEDLTVHKQLARLLVRLGKPEDARALLTRMRANYPEDLELLVMLGDVHSRLLDFSAADRYYRLALVQAKGAQGAPLMGRLGYSKIKQGDTTAAIDIFETLVGDDASDAAVPLTAFLGMLYLSEGRIADARETANRIIESQPANLVAQNLLAVAAIAAGDRGHARAILEAIDREDPDFRPADINLVKLDILEKDYLSAARRLKALLAEDPKDVVALRESARLAAVQADYTQAIERLEQIRKLNPAAIEPMTELTRLYLQLDRSAEALQVALELDREVPNNFSAKMNMALVQEGRGEFALTRSLLNEAGLLAGSNPEELVDVAKRLILVGDLETADVLVRKALQIRPQFVPAHETLGLLYVRRGDLEQAALAVSRILDQQSESVSLLSLLADIRMQQRQPRPAIELYRKSLAIVNSPVTMIKLHRALFLNGQADAALAELKAWDASNPGSPLIMRVLADHYDYAGDRGKAIKLYSDLVQVSPGNVMAYNNLANLLISVDGERALKSALKAYELAPENAEVLDTLGWILVQLGDLGRGLSYLREAAVRDSRSATTRYHLSVALEEYGNREAAIRELKNALALEKDFPERDNAIQRLQRLENL
jgi:putative PEP-CTERM system TPR-repeat lipoprotein